MKPGSPQAAKAAEDSLTRQADDYWANPEYVCIECGWESTNNTDWDQDCNDDWTCKACLIADARGIVL